MVPNKQRKLIFALYSKLTLRYIQRKVIFALHSLTTLQPKIVDELLGTRNCEADERKRINEMV